jgi:hypothetical protein
MKDAGKIVESQKETVCWQAVSKDIRKLMDSGEPRMVKLSTVGEKGGKPALDRMRDSDTLGLRQVRLGDSGRGDKSSSGKGETPLRGAVGWIGADERCYG